MTQNKISEFHSLKTKLLLAVVAVSTFFTTVVVLTNFYFDYLKELKELDRKIHLIQASNISSITNLVWSFDTDSLHSQIESISRIEDVASVRIIDQDGNFVIEKYRPKKRKLKKDDLKHYSFPLIYTSSDGERHPLGRLEITATTFYIKRDLLNGLLIFIVSQALSTFFISYLILLIFHHYLIRNLDQVINFIQNFNLKSSNEKLQIKRKGVTKDEFDLLQDSMNSMIEEINYLNADKEMKISDQEKKIELQQMIAINSSKMAALGEMAGGIAHEINNPLAIISMNAKAMERNLESGNLNLEAIIKSAKVISRTADRIGSIVTSLRTISRDASHEGMDMVSLREVLTDVFSISEEKFKHLEIPIICDLTKPVFEEKILCNHIQLSQVFLNLLNNSYDSIKKQSNKWVKVEGRFDGEWIIIDVLDSGLGVPKEIQNKIFQPFYTTKDIGEGTGLGLSISYRIIKDHRGLINYNTDYPNTCFTIKLPRKTSKQP